MDIDNHIPIANYIFVTITAGVLAYVTVMSEDVDKSYEMPPEYADKDEDEETQDTPETLIKMKMKKHKTPQKHRLIQLITRSQLMIIMDMYLRLVLGFPGSLQG